MSSGDAAVESVVAFLVTKKSHDDSYVSMCTNFSPCIDDIRPQSTN